MYSTPSPASRTRGRLGPALGAAGAVLALWSLTAWSGAVAPGLLPTPAETAAALAGSARSGLLASDVAASLTRAGQGFALGALIGSALGFATGYLPRLSAAVTPLVSFLRPIPAIALVPLATAWFGIGETAKRLLIAYAVLLAVWLYVHDGVSRVPVSHLRAARTLGAPLHRRFTEVLLPAAAPALLAALRYGASVALLALVAAELGGADSGLAYRLQVDGQFLRVDRMFAGLLVLGLLGVAVDLVLAGIGRRFVHWSAS
ncbi:ABC transporter permease subunit [Streptomyces flavotricini]|uniref:ABC transporter permease subunit n=1 Tax=Streptomyces flavotricini TaxID=66888 RepID=A0ABS8EG36_9ACTN|nr:ABC transporter permease subunit [Streptomyces flavotricini]MCC0100120.1 ABC transporter permease subunit [Streptomyces flavotricini]